MIKGNFLNRNNVLLFAIMVTIHTGCKKSSPGRTNTTITTTTTTPNTQHISVLTQHNDNTRAGLNSQETVLTTSNVNSQRFGKLYTLTVDDQVYAQPLVVGNLPISNGAHNVVFIATVNNTVYAYDGDNGSLYWNKNYTVSGMRPPKNTDMNSGWCTPYLNFTTNVGIAGTPVIDSAGQTMYFVARSTDGVNFLQYLHAVNIITGAEQAGSPVQITASVPGTGDGSKNGVLNFDQLRSNQRQGLTLVNGVVYITFAGHCDWNPYHGWILGYNSKTLQQQIVYNDTPNGENGGIWESGMGMAADAQGNLYVVTGNGTTGTQIPYTETGNGTAETTTSPDPTDPTNRGESALKLTPAGNTLQISSYFTPSNYVDLNTNDLDYGVMGTFLIPNTSLYLTGCKDGNLYLLNKDNMGGFSFTSNAVQQTISLNESMRCQPAYYNGGANQFIYVWPATDQLRPFAFNPGNGTLTPTVATTPDAGPTGSVGADISVSSNGTLSGTGILWVSYATSGDAGGENCPGILRAYDAANVNKELWNSSQNSGDGVGYFAKFCSPTIADGHVYLATFSNEVLVYGLK